MSNGDMKYAALFYISDDGFIENIEVAEGVITKEVNAVDVEFRAILLGKEQTVILPKHNIFNLKEEAERRIEAALAWKERKALYEAVRGNINFLPRVIAESEEVFISGNPLRIGEPNMCFGSQANTWGEDDNSQKVLQIAGAIWEDIEILKNVLYVLGYANNYTKKLIGKYIIIELNSLYMCFKRLSDMDSDYKSNLFAELQSAIKQLEDKYKFRQ